MSKKGLPKTLQMRHDSHYVEELSQSRRTVGRIIPTRAITPNPHQPRTEFGDLSNLIASIKEKGILEPLLVKPIIPNQKWLIIAGERRWRAATHLGLTEVPCIEMDISDETVAEIALIENLQRKDLTVWEEADGLLALAQKFGYTHEQIAAKIGKSRSTITEMFSIASIPPKIRELCLAKKIETKSALLNVARCFDEEDMLNYLDRLNAELLVSKKPISQSKISKPPKKDKDKDDDRFDSLNPENKFPLKKFTFSDKSGDFKFEIKFKKISDKNDLRNALRKILATL